MIIEFFKSTIENIKERVKNPFIESNKTPFAGAYIIALILYNWKLFFSFFNFDNVDDRQSKISIISNYLEAEPWFYRIGNPILIAFSTILAFYILNNLSLGITTFFNRWFKATVLEIFDKGKKITREELDKKHRDMERLRLSYESLRTTFTQSQNTIEDLNTIIKGRDSSISEMSNNISRALEEKDKLSIDNSILQKYIETLENKRDAFRILYARYGYRDKFNDVREIVQKILIEENSKLDVINSVLNGDPAEGKIKHLFLVYEYNNKIETLNSIEGAIIQLVENRLIESMTEVGLNNHTTLKMQKKLSEIFQGTWLLEYKSTTSSKTEILRIDDEGNYLSTSDLSLTLGNIGVDNKLIHFEKVKEDGKVLSVETLQIKNDNLIVGHDTLGYTLRYTKI